MMFESIEDMIEESVWLNQKSLPFLQGMAKMVETSTNDEFKKELSELILGLDKFFYMLENHADETGEVTSEQFESRKFH